MTILLCGRPGSSAGHLVAEPVRLAPDGVWLAAVSPRRWWALTPPFHPYLRRLARSVAGGLLSVPLSVGFRRLGRPSVLPCGVRTFLERRSARGHPACESNCSGVCSEPVPARRVELHSGQVIIPPACRTNSPQTRHSRLAPRSNACSSCSSVRCRGAPPLTA